jgi:hypothetical protein
LDSVASVRATDSISAFTKLSVMGSDDADFLAGGAACATDMPVMMGAKAKLMARPMTEVKD